jgi:hypothetical protein
MQISILPPYHTTALSLIIQNKSGLVELNNESTTLDRVDEDVAAGESEVAPGADEFDLASSGSLREDVSTHAFQKRIWANWTDLVIFWVNVKPSDTLDVLPGGVFGYTRDVQDSEARAVVRQRGAAVFDVEVVVDTLLLVSGFSG